MRLSKRSNNSFCGLFDMGSIFNIGPVNAVGIKTEKSLMKNIISTHHFANNLDFNDPLSIDQEQ